MNHSQITQKQVEIPSDHPSLAGHFPANPVLPGVVLLDNVRRCIEAWKPVCVSGSRLVSVKFISPLLLGHESVQRLQIVLEVKNKSTADCLPVIEFNCLQDDRLIAQGSWQLSAEQTK